MALLLYLGLLALVCALALRDWRRAWVLLPILIVTQDPVRKLTPGAPVAVSFLILLFFAVSAFSARGSLRVALRDFTGRFPAISSTGIVFLFFLAFAAINGLATFGIRNWQIPTVSLVTYIAPISGVLIGYCYLDRESRFQQFIHSYAFLTAIALAGTGLEYARVESRVLGLVASSGDYIRHIPGLQIRLLSGFYRSPDIMAWHAATLTAISLGMAVRAGLTRRGYLWAALAGGAFTACMLSGRRKAIYYVAVFCLVFLWRYIRRLQGAQIVALASVAMIGMLVIKNIAANEKTSVYAAGARTTPAEVFRRLEGGVGVTLEQSGWLGAGLGMATQGTHHLANDVRVGWQEGGIAKLAAELGVPGLLVAAILLYRLFRTSLRLTRIGDVPGSGQFLRVLLFSLVFANAVNFMASAQAYSDPVLALLTAFMIGSMLATASLDEREPVPAEAATADPRLGLPAHV